MRWDLIELWSPFVLATAILYALVACASGYATVSFFFARLGSQLRSAVTGPSGRVKAFISQRARVQGGPDCLLALALGRHAGSRHRRLALHCAEKCLLLHCRRVMSGRAWGLARFRDMQAALAAAPRTPH